MAIRNKAHSGAKKRFRISKSGKVKARRSHRSHILTKKSAKRKLHLRKNRFLNDCDTESVKRLIGGS